MNWVQWASHIDYQGLAVRVVGVLPGGGAREAFLRPSRAWLGYAGPTLSRQRQSLYLSLRSLQNVSLLGDGQHAAASP